MGGRLRLLKALIYALLLANTLYFALAESPSKAIDAAAWLTLLLAFEAETSFARHVRSTRGRRVIRAIRGVAAVGVFAALLGYFSEDNALDAINAALWIGVVVMLEAELRFAEFVGRNRYLWRTLAASLYGGLAVLVVIWAARGMWLDAYDALLWLVAFVTIELALTGRTGARAPRPAGLTPG